MISEPQSSSCPTCGSPIAADVPGGWCPACLERNLLDGGADQDEAEDVLDRVGKVGPYRLLEEIGAGGFGVVWRAEQTAPIRREVALKLVKPGMDSRAIVHRFEAERRTLALMEHPNIAAVLDAGTSADGRPYFVMELVRGQPITAYCDERKLTLRQRIELFLPVCHAVHHAHQKAILHRDLKPSNILVTEVDGKPVPKVIDFGIAKALGSGDSLRDDSLIQQTLPGAVVGTVQYMSPEQAGTEPDLDTRSDIYTLGVILYELLAGRTPLARETIRKAAMDEVLRMVREGEIPRPSTTTVVRDEATETVAGYRGTTVDRLRGSMRGDLDWITLRALEKERERRYDSAQALADDLQRYLRDEPVHAGPPGRTYRMRKFLRRNKVMTAAVAAVALALIAGTTVSLWWANKAGESARVAGENARVARDSETKVIAGLKEASRADAATAQQRLADGQWHESVAYLGRAIRFDPDNQIAWEALWLTSRYGTRDVDRQPILSLEHPGRLSRASFSPDGTRITTANEDENVNDHIAKEWDAKTGAPVGTSKIPAERFELTVFSSDFRRVLIGTFSKNTAQVWDARTGTPIGVPLKHPYPVRSAAFSPDGTRVVTACQDKDKTAQIWDVETGSPIAGPLVNEDFVGTVAFSPNGGYVVTLNSKVMRIWDARTGDPVGGPIRHPSINKFAFSPDEARVVTTSFDKTARIWDVKTGTSIGSPLSHLGAVNGAAFSPDGTRIVTTSSDHTASVWDAQTGLPVVLPLKHNSSVTQASFSPDGIRIVTVSGDNTARVWDVRNGTPIGIPIRHDNGFKGCGLNEAVFSPDGKLVLTSNNDRSARVWESRADAPVGSPVFPHDSWVSSAAFSPDGSRIVTASENGMVSVWDTKTGMQIGTPIKQSSAATSAVFSPDGARIVTTVRGNTAQVWDARTGAAIGSPLKHDSEVECAVFSPDGTRVVTASLDNTGRVWNSQTGAPVSPPLKHDRPVICAGFTPDSSRVITLGWDHTSRVWDARTGIQVGPPITLDRLDDSAFLSPDATRMVVTWIVATELNCAQVFDTRSGSTIGAPLCHKDRVRCAAFSPDGTRIITASWDGTARIWDARTGIPIGPPLEHHGSVTCAAFSPDGTQVVTASRDQTVRVWDVKPLLPLAADVAESYAAVVASARLDPQLGSLKNIPPNDCLALQKILDPTLSKLPDWRFAAGPFQPFDPKTALASPRTKLTIRQTTTALIATMNPITLREALAIDPTHPLLPFAYADVEADKTRDQPANPVRAAWLIAYGMKHLPTDASAADLRLAARYVALMVRILPAQKGNALELLDRAAKLAREDNETKKLRDSLR